MDAFNMRNNSTKDRFRRARSVATVGSTPFSEVCGTPFLFRSSLSHAIKNSYALALALSRS